MSLYALEKMQKINSGYVNKDCVQFMISHHMPYLSVIGDRVIYNAPEGREATINEYLKDSRRFNFPYHNIPTHRQKKGKILFNYVNQIYEYDKPYIVLKDRTVNEHFVTKSANEKYAIIISRKIKPIFIGGKYDLNSEELVQNLYEKYIKLEGKKYIFANGGYLTSEEEFLYNFKSNNYLIVTVDGNHKSIKGLKVAKNNTFYDLIDLDFSIHNYKGSDIRTLEDYAGIIPDPKISKIHNLSIPREEVIKARTMAAMKNKSHKFN